MAATLRGRLTGTLRLGLVDCTVTNPSSPISRAIGRFNNRDHEVTIEVTVGPPAELQRGVLDGSLHIAMACFPSESPKLSPSRFMAKSIGSTAAPEHRLFDRKAINLEDLTGCRIVARSYWRGSDTLRDWESNSLRHQSTSWKPGKRLFCLARIWEPTGTLCLALVAAGKLRCILPEKLSYVADFSSISRSERLDLPPVRQFMEDLRMSFAELSSRPGARKRKPDRRDKLQPLRDGP